jgi:hypothetical protein
MFLLAFNLVGIYVLYCESLLRLKYELQTLYIDRNFFSRKIAYLYLYQLIIPCQNNRYDAAIKKFESNT